MTDEQLDNINLHLDQLPNDYWRAEIRQLINDYREYREHINLLEKEGRRYRDSITKYRSAIWRLVEAINDCDLAPEDWRNGYDEALANEAEKARKLYKDGA